MGKESEGGVKKGKSNRKEHRLRCRVSLKDGTPEGTGKKESLVIMGGGGLWGGKEELRATTGMSNGGKKEASAVGWVPVERNGGTEDQGRLRVDHRKRGRGGNGRLKMRRCQREQGFPSTKKQQRLRGTVKKKGKIRKLEKARNGGGGGYDGVGVGWGSATVSKGNSGKGENLRGKGGISNKGGKKEKRKESQTTVWECEKERKHKNRRNEERGGTEEGKSRGENRRNGGNTHNASIPALC